MLTVRKFPELTPEQERVLDREVDEGIGNYGQVIAKVIGVDVFSPDFKKILPQDEPAERQREKPKDQLTI